MLLAVLAVLLVRVLRRGPLALPIMCAPPCSIAGPVVITPAHRPQRTHGIHQIHNTKRPAPTVAPTAAPTAAAAAAAAAAGNEGY